MKNTTLDIWFSRWVRLNAADDNGIVQCVTCGKFGSVKHMENGHYVKRSVMAARYSEMNCNVQCNHCNWVLQGNDAKYRQFLVDKYGENKVLLLEATKRNTTKLSSGDIKIMIEHYKSEVNRLLKEKGIQKWW